MKIPFRLLLAAALLAAGGSPLAAQHLHTNDRWEDCAFVIDPSLTQEAWRQFVSEVGLVAYFRPLASARPLGARRIELALLSSATRIDDADAAWNDTFSHPDSTHWLFEGDALMVPGLMLRVGATDRMDVGAYFTKNPKSNYGIAGAQVQYALLNDTTRGVAAAGRVSYARLFGPDDLTASVYGLDLVVSKDISVFAPYVGVSGYLSRGHERTAKVDLEDENVLGVQVTTGVAVHVSVLRLGAEVNLARVPGYAFKVAFGT
ncbi:MAG TPA: hypothetical protein VK939_03665 [Longimicrobiales bacterium]|nr:hypothetical protein [Longimicrobiales bacterium]